jgi:hypothetical protein
MSTVSTMPVTCFLSNATIVRRLLKVAAARRAAILFTCPKKNRRRPDRVLTRGGMSSISPAAGSRTQITIDNKQLAIAIVFANCLLSIAYCLFGCDPFQANRFFYRNSFARISKKSCHRITAEDHDLVAVLIADQ